MRILVTGGAGFIGVALVNYILSATPHEVVNVDKLTYAADPASAELKHPRYRFIRADICDRTHIDAIFREIRPDAVMHLAAESHVDRSIDSPSGFMQTNIIGTFEMVSSATAYWSQLDARSRGLFRFHHVSTDEVFGDLQPDDLAFSETSRYAPSNPYSASKAGSDHIVWAWHRTYGLPVVISNCSNNYGPRQFPEKLIPLTILNAVGGRPLPVYGDGLQVRDWLFVEDHAEALHQVLTAGRVGETYNIGGLSERRNIEVVQLICTLLEDKRPSKIAGLSRYTDLITSVADRPGHDRRYAIDCTKISEELGWRPRETFESGLRRTVDWYLDHLEWCEQIRSSRYDGQRIGLFAKQGACAT